ncbi:MAG: hypothetical protein M3R17_13340 [Bacteroidota bacterium]|nr:hypothetical protein [Bacteroidota bacterium]
MKHRIHFSKLILPALFILFTAVAVAQNNYTRVAAGFNFGHPKLAEGYNGGEWKGVNIRSKFLEMGYMSAGVFDPSGTRQLGYNAYMGVNFPIKSLMLGKREYGIKGFLVVPFVAGDLGFAGIGKGHSFQATVAPGISLQLPYTVIDFKLNTSIAFGNVPGFYRQKVLFMPTIVFQFDALWDVMDPVLKFDGHYEGVTQSTSYHTEVEEHVTYTEYTTYSTTTYSPYSYDSYKRDVGPHISLGPRISYWNLKNAGSTFMKGIQQSGRAHGFGYDLIAENGGITTAEGYDLKATRVMGRLSFDFNVSKEGLTHFTRLMIGPSLGYCWFTQSDARVRSENSQFFGYFLSLEVGAVSFSFEKNYAFYNKFDNQRYFSVSYNIPFERVFERYKQLRESR